MCVPHFVPLLRLIHTTTSYQHASLPAASPRILLTILDILASSYCSDNATDGTHLLLQSVTETLFVAYATDLSRTYILANFPISFFQLKCKCMIIPEQSHIFFTYCNRPCCLNLIPERIRYWIGEGASKSMNLKKERVLLQFV